MSEAVPVAFYAPLKNPHHPSPSGDRTMARLLLKALQAGGFDPVVASTIRTFDRLGDKAIQESLRTQSEADAARLIAIYRDAQASLRPRLWFTYHVYYKAPDWIGPRVADALDIPYVIAEGSRAGKRAQGAWATGHAAAETALDRADAIFVMTAADRPALDRSKSARQELVDLPAFLNFDEWPRISPLSPAQDRHRAPRLLTVAMMRRGDKLASYTILGEALARLERHAWTLDIVGDGEARATVEQLFSGFGPRVRFWGEIEDRSRLAAFYGEADLFLWPAVNEAYGMVLLEAQAFGCPVVAGDYGGVASVVRDGATGVLTPAGSVAAFAEALQRLLDCPGRRQALAAAARRFVEQERGLEPAAETLRSALLPLIAAKRGS